MPAPAREHPLFPALATLKTIPPRMRPKGTSLGHGKDGHVYATGTKGVVLKITQDRDEAKAALALRKLALPLLGIVQFYKVAAFIRPDGTTFFGLWRDEIKPAHARNQHIVGLVVNLQQALARLAERRETGHLAAANEVNDAIDDFYRYSAGQLGELGESLLALANQGIILRDSHPGNIGNLDGRATLFDVGRAWLSPYWQGFAIPEISLPA